MFTRHTLSLFLLLLGCLQHRGDACGVITTEVFPSSITLSSSFADITCNHRSSLDFVSFYLPSTITLTTSNLPKYTITRYTTHTTLTVSPVDAADVGEYQCNFRDEEGNDCFEDVTLQLDVDFCTPSSVTYHRYIGESVAMECCVENHVNQYWTRGTSTEPIEENENIELLGTELRLRSVGLEDAGRYRCVAEAQDEDLKTITATLKAYERLSITVEPHQKVVNISERAELTCTANSFPLPVLIWARDESTQLQIQDGVIGKMTRQLNSTARQSVLTFYSVTDEVTGTYRCTGVYDNGTLSAVSTLQLFGTPSAPQEVVLSVANQTNIDVTWKPPLDDGHLQLLQYLIMWFRIGTDGEILERESDTVNGSTNDYIIADLHPVTNYTVTLYAINRRGKGMGSEDRSILTLPTVPGVISNLQTNQLTSSSVHIEFTLPIITGGTPITHLRTTTKAGDDETLIEAHPLTDAVPSQRRSHRLVDLKGDTPYTVSVSVGNSVGFGPEMTAYFKTLRPGYPATPTSVRPPVGGVRTTSVVLSWEVVDVGKPNTEYFVRALQSGVEGEGELFTVKPEQLDVDENTESAVISPLRPETCYTFTVTIRNDEGLGFTSEPSNITCTLSCKQDACDTVAGVKAGGDDGPSNAQLIPILVVTVVVAIVVLLVVVLVAVLSRRYSNRRKSSLNLISTHNHNFATGSISSSHVGSMVDPTVSSSSSSSLGLLNRQISQNSSSATDPEDAPTTSSSTVSENPFYFGTIQSQNGSPQYQNRPHVYQNGTETLLSIGSHSSIGMATDCGQPGVKTIGSYPLFPIPEHRVAMGGHFENSAPAIPIRAHPQVDKTVMTENPAFTAVIEEGTPPPIPPYRSNSFSDSTDSSQPTLHIHTHQNSQPPIPPRSHSANSFPYLGESLSQVPQTEFFLPDSVADDEEEEEVQFMDNGAYESATPQPLRRDDSQLPNSAATLPHSSRPSYTNLSVSSLPRGQSASPVLPRRGSAQSTGSGFDEGPRFEIARQQDRERGGRGLVFETVTIKSRV